MKSIFLFKSRGIEGIPVIIRFKTHLHHLISFRIYGIEGIPVIIRFKTMGIDIAHGSSGEVLKVFQL